MSLQARTFQHLCASSNAQRLVRWRRPHPEASEWTEGKEVAMPPIQRSSLRDRNGVGPRRVSPRVSQGGFFSLLGTS